MPLVTLCVQISHEGCVGCKQLVRKIAFQNFQVDDELELMQYLATLSFRNIRTSPAFRHSLRRLPAPARGQGSEEGLKDLAGLGLAWRIAKIECALSMRAPRWASLTASPCPRQRPH